ncbi:MAG: hypothetical protein KAI67_03120 [Candidatus Pacebacteria bacterium]|nr:hypothetical protein [Candidatus Paceibacterota bacterium]
MFENIHISPLSMMGIILIAFSLLKYRRTRNEAEGFILFSIGLGLTGYSLLVHYIMMDYIDIRFLFAGELVLFFAVLFG